MLHQVSCSLQLEALPTLAGRAWNLFPFEEACLGWDVLCSFLRRPLQVIHSYLDSFVSRVHPLILVGIFNVARRRLYFKLSPVAQQLCCNRRHSRAQALNPTSGWRLEGLSFVCSRVLRKKECRYIPAELTYLWFKDLESLLVERYSYASTE